MTPDLVYTDKVMEILKGESACAVGVSGGKDSIAVAFAVDEFLTKLDYQGPRLLIHADLGSVEWKDSLPTCERLAKAIGWELVVVKRQAGDMMERWRTRWRNNVARYVNLECVKLILPWSTPSMRFCTAEMKRDVICSELRKRFAGKTILSVTGIRRQESTNRAKSPILKEQPKLTGLRAGTSGFDWNPLLDWTLDDVYKYAKLKKFPLHEAYTKYGSSRVSCCFCIMSTVKDMTAAASCSDNHDIYRQMVDLEIESTFSFQSNQWLANVAMPLLPMETVTRLEKAKKCAEAREFWEEKIPKHLLYTSGWPTCLPTKAEAELLATVRKRVGSAVGIPVKYTNPDEIITRYKELMAVKKKPLELVEE